MHFCRHYRNWNFKLDLHTHLRDKHGHLFLWDLELFWTLFKVGQTKVENIHVCRVSHNWVLKVGWGRHLRDKHGHLFLWDLQLVWLSFKVDQTKVEKMNFCWLVWNWFWKWIKVPIWEISMDTYFYEIWNYFGLCSRLVKLRLKICTFVDFLRIEILKYI